ncbi:MAG: hypothetical protein L0Y58_04485 [Verrucomicrobia subdivision 3 bacterium]|nr:hypothetical protein [Limisphaerales bacterium]
MPAPDLFLVFVRPLNRAGIRYAVTGSVAAIFYGQPRVTHDVDFVVFLSDSDIEALRRVFPNDQFYVPPSETIVAERQREQRGHFNVIHLATGFKADLYLAGRDELNAWALRGRRQAQLEGEDVTLAPPEYVIVRKLEYYREGGSEKHLLDIRSMLIVSGNQLDRAALDQWIQRRGLEPEWRRVSSAPDR